ncbi:zf-MYND and DUF4470 domain-containing protein [Phanerochaete sordida]|uniref:Zf-MYND and DUF4470 domain-containing protein n=1 Tax=Phanerochaete sordida TaxID=48140 RepID=A0A9P3LCJ1_9APHY|nr:zf-MYND and DUF4470 domain-containing protein [Phanerochaete sordida]
MPLTIQELGDRLAQLSLRDQKAAEVVAWLKHNVAHRAEIAQEHRARAHEYDMPNDPAEWRAFLARHGLTERDVFQGVVSTVGDDGPAYIMSAAPCAYAHPDPAMLSDECRKPGTQACSGCRLVKYCSKECQRKHWKTHAKDCKASIRTDKWQPAWIEEGRQPTFVTEDPNLHPVARALPLWGTMPGIDVLKLSPEDALSRPDIDLAFVASGDLRSVLSTINALPPDYPGQVTVLMNDRDQHITIRNILILQLLGRIPNKRRAADMALHLWYSAFVPKAYGAELVGIGMELCGKNADELQLQLGEHATLNANMSADMRKLCSASIMSSFKWKTEQAQKELRRVRQDPSRVDVRHRAWAQCRGSHRLARDAYNRTGLVLPFGAHAAHFDTPNRFLFSPAGAWLLSDGANPLAGWDIEAVVASGVAHGCTPEDLYGGLYFHVVGALEALGERLRTLRVAFTVANQDAGALASALAPGAAALRFDRIDVSNLGDADYLGVPRVLDAWAPFLKRERGAALLGHFVNWVAREPRAEPGPEETRRIMQELVSSGKIAVPDQAQGRSPEALKARMLAAVMQAAAAAYDSSDAFEAHLAQQGLSAALKKAGLRRRLQHEIVPHRLCAPLDGTPAALPAFRDDESWYLQVNVAAPMWTERYIELVPA